MIFTRQGYHMKFDVRQTNIAKGVAVLLLLWHHVFFNSHGSYGHYHSLLKFGDLPVEAVISDMFKVCVAIFLILSGYGMYQSYAKNLEKSKKKGIRFDLSFIRYRLLKLYIPFWFIYVIFVPMGLLFGRDYAALYGSPLNAVADFFGLAYLIHGPLSFTANAAWWYMSIIIVFCVLYPLLHRFLTYSPELTLAIALLLNFSILPAREYEIWFLPFVLGMYASRRNLFEKMHELLSTDTNRVLASFLLVIAFALCKNTFYDDLHFDFAFGFAIILFVYFAISRIPGVSLFLEDIGKKSGLIFMFHSFIYSLYFATFIYSFKYPPLIYLVLLGICYGVSWILQLLIDVTRVNKLNKLTL